MTLQRSLLFRKIPSPRFFDVMVEQIVTLYPVAAFKKSGHSLETRPVIVVGEPEDLLEEVLKLLPQEEFEEHFIGGPILLDRRFLVSAMLSGKAKVKTFAIATDDRTLKLTLAWAISPGEREPSTPEGKAEIAVFEEVLTSERVNELCWKAGYFRPDNRIYPV